MVTERFTLSAETVQYLKSLKQEFGFNGFGEVTYYRTYSRIKPDGSQEDWADTIIRVVNGIFSIRKHHYIQNGLAWDEEKWQQYAYDFAVSMHNMEFLPPGRGLWAMGTEYVYKRGSMALNNCGAVDTTNLAHACEWTMDALMCGVGVGFNTAWEGEATKPDKSDPTLFVIPDSREGWAQSVKLLVEAYTDKGPWYRFDYSEIRPYGTPIKGFGGTASGPEPLKELHRRMEKYLDDYCEGEYDTTRTVADIFNAIGACVVAGNVRRSAEIALGRPDDITFLDLKNYDKNPEREEIGWMSNNTVILSKSEDFELIPKIARHIRHNGEPGIMNLINVQKYGRFGKEMPDKAWLSNPCSEIPLEGFELCNLAEVFPTRCKTHEDFYKALEYATFYASTVCLLPTHRPETNAIVARNRRIGVSLSGIADYLDQVGAAKLTRLLREGYKIVRAYNRKLAEEAGVPPSIRVTTVKPSGTISQLAGVSSGMHFPTFKYAIRRIRVAQNSPIAETLIRAGVPHEKDYYSEHTLVFEFPIDQGKTRKATDVSAWEQFALLAMLQREWSDNMVSCTIYFDQEREGDQIGHMLAQFAPVIKSVSMLPHTKVGAYEQMPYEGISREEYERRLAALKPIDWSGFSGSDGEDSRYCVAHRCDAKEFESDRKNI
ncbi:MAG: fused protease/ribonucleoside-triphosphate reductase [Campylobacteraceae bacterium 4484_4]|nr:MAG: fused protease/ribonucleoside-triphosphate reductase [Campylobacteraceae bacterium 4484_4]